LLTVANDGFDESHFAADVTSRDVPSANCAVAAS